MSEARAVTVTPTRLPYIPELEQRYGIAPEDWRALVDAVFPSAKTIEGVMLALSYCRSRKLDPFKRPVHIVPVWNSTLNREVETVWPGIGELRTTAHRTGLYQGCDSCEFGPNVTKEFAGDVGRRGSPKMETIDVTFPEWAQLTVYRSDRNGSVSTWHGPRVYWLETYGRRGKSEVPNEMWARRSRGQLEKCAEAAALRRAFPEEVGEQLVNDEIGDQMRDVTPAVAAAPAARAVTFARQARPVQAPQDEPPEPSGDRESNWPPADTASEPSAAGEAPEPAGGDDPWVVVGSGGLRTSWFTASQAVSAIEQHAGNEGSEDDKPAIRHRNADLYRRLIAEAPDLVDRYKAATESHPPEVAPKRQRKKAAAPTSEVAPPSWQIVDIAGTDMGTHTTPAAALKTLEGVRKLTASEFVPELLERNREVLDSIALMADPDLNDRIRVLYPDLES